MGTLRILLLFVLSCSAQGAQLTGHDYPYDIYNDAGVTRYCMEPDPGDTHRSCYAKGVETMCKILPADEGYIDCNNYDVIDYEQATRVVMKDGTSFMCLLTYEGKGFTGSYKWIGLTCAKMGVKPLAWQFCKAISGKPIMKCSPPTADADPGSGPKIRMKTL